MRYSGTSRPGAPPPDYRWGPHFQTVQRIADVADVSSPATRRIKVHLEKCCVDGTIIVVTGLPGAGKSFGIGRAVDAVAAHFRLTVVWVELADKPTEKAFLTDLHISLTGEGPPRGSAADIRRVLYRILAERRWLIVLDEAQHASPVMTRNLRWLQDKLATRFIEDDGDRMSFGFVISGTPDTYGNLPPEIKSRCTAHIELERLADAAAPAWLREYHPLFKDVDEELLVELNRGYARGDIRWWATMLGRAVKLVARGNALTVENVPLFTADL